MPLTITLPRPALEKQAQDAPSLLTRQADQKQADEWRNKRPFVLCFKNMSLASSIAFSNNSWTNKPSIGGSQVYTRVGSRVFKAQSFEAADSYYQRARPPDIPHTSTAQGLLVVTRVVQWVHMHSVTSVFLLVPALLLLSRSLWASMVLVQNLSGGRGRHHAINETG